MLDQRLYEYVYDTESPETNYNLAIEYKKINQYASALSYFLRCAERTTDINLTYECLIHIGNCFDAQGRRVNSAFNSYKQAISILPKRPEAYYHICRLKNWNSVFDDGYTYSSIALDICDFENTVPLNDPGPYTGKHCLLFEKALSAWYWGKVEECKELFLFLWENHWIEMDTYQKYKTQEILKTNYDIDVTLINSNRNSTNNQLEINNSSNFCIPVIGVPIVNGVHWLKRLILSVDYPVKNFFIVNNNGRGEITEELNELCSMNHPFIENIHVSHMPSNLGVSGSWNLIIKSYMLEPYWVLPSHDTAFSPGMLERMYLEAENNHDVGMIHGKKSPEYDSGMYDLFLIKDWVIQKCGLFDENCYPAYCEDLDYYINCKNNNVNYKVLNIDYLHGEKDYSTSGSQTSKLEPSLKEKLDKSRILNSQYLYEKWGNDCLTSNEYIEQKKIKYDLNFLREKHMGF